jgi:hypothetical protein
MGVTNEQWKALYDAARTELAARDAEIHELRESIAVYDSGVLDEPMGEHIKRLQAENARLRAIEAAAREMLDGLDSALSADDWSTSELRTALAATHPASEAHAS